MGCPAGAGSGWVGGGASGSQDPPPPPTAQIYTLGNYRFHSGLEDREAKKWQFLLGGVSEKVKTLGQALPPLR